jgi:hypothetical protein
VEEKVLRAPGYCGIESLQFSKKLWNRKPSIFQDIVEFSFCRILRGAKSSQFSGFSGAENSKFPRYNIAESP